MAGPVIVGVITVAAEPAIGLLVAAGLAGAGTGLFPRSPALGRQRAAAASPPQTPDPRQQGPPG